MLHSTRICLHTHVTEAGVLAAVKVLMDRISVVIASHMSM
jgi:hypothetical protein